MGHKGLNKQKQTKKKQRFLETVGIGGMSLFFFLSPGGRPHFSPSSLSRFLCLQGRRRPLSGCHVSSSDTCRWHFPDIRVPKQDILFNPKFVAKRPKAIQNEILPTNPCVEHLTDISPYILKSVGLTARQLAFLAFVVAPVELIYDEVLDVFKVFL